MITPIFIPITGGGRSGPKKPDHTCPKCKHQFNDPATPGDSTIIPVSIWLTLHVIAFVVLFIWGSEYYKEHDFVSVSGFYDQVMMDSFIPFLALYFLTFIDSVLTVVGLCMLMYKLIRLFNPVRP